MNRNPVDRDAKAVLVIIQGRLGDAINALAPLAAIRAYHPAAQLTVLTEPRHIRLLQRCPHVDRIDVRSHPSRLANKAERAWSIRQSRYDMVYDLARTAASSALFAWLKPGPPQWSGVAEGCSHPHADRGRDRLHPLDRHAEQLWLCGIGPEEGYPAGTAPLPDLSWYADGLAAPQTLRPQAQGLRGSYALLLADDTATGSWPLDRFADVADVLEANGVRPVLVGQPGAAKTATRIRAAAPMVLDLVSRLDLFQVIGLARHASLCIGLQGDLSVLAAAAGAPCVVLVDPALGPVRQLAPRGRATVGLTARSLADVGVERVLAAARAVEPAGPAEDWSPDRGRNPLDDGGLTAQAA